MQDVIPEKLQSDHLFLLIGTNPLPNYVAARLLLRERGLIYLVHSDKDIVVSIAQRLSKKLLKQGYRQPEYVPIGNASDPHAVYTAIAKRVSEIKSGQIGLNYTGGTKVMAVQSYRAVEKELASGLPLPIFSYLDASTLSMRFEGEARERFVGMDTRAAMSLPDLINLHDEYNFQQALQEPIAPEIVEALEQIHRSEQVYRDWRKHITEAQKTYTDADTIESFVGFKPVAEALAQERQYTTTLRVLCQEKIVPFNNPKELLNWMEGKWLESYVVSILKQNKASYRLNDFGRSFRVRSPLFKFEADVAAMRGYQLHVISCYTGHDTQRATHKLIECLVRSRQIGGDEAGAAVVCMSEDPSSIENDVSHIYDISGRVKVFGRRQLPDLAEHLSDWFNIGIPKEEA
jgi:hypothetical protein